MLIFVSWKSQLPPFLCLRKKSVERCNGIHRTEAYCPLGRGVLNLPVADPEKLPRVYRLAYVVAKNTQWAKAPKPYTILWHILESGIWILSDVYTAMSVGWTAMQVPPLKDRPNGIFLSWPWIATSSFGLYLGEHSIFDALRGIQQSTVLRWQSMGLCDFNCRTNNTACRILIPYQTQTVAFAVSGDSENIGNIFVRSPMLSFISRTTSVLRSHVVSSTLSSRIPTTRLFHKVSPRSYFVSFIAELDLLASFVKTNNMPKNLTLDTINPRVVAARWATTEAEYWRALKLLVRYAVRGELVLKAQVSSRNVFWGYEVKTTGQWRFL